jgi:hypothetical protein
LIERGSEIALDEGTADTHNGPSIYERINFLYRAFRKLLLSSGHITLSVLFQEPESQR